MKRKQRSSRKKFKKNNFTINYNNTMEWIGKI